MPEIRWKDMGQHLASIVGLDKDEKLIRALPIKEFAENQYLIFFTKQGMAKKTELSQYKAQRYNRPLMAVKLKADDEVVDVSITNGNEDIFLATYFGFGLWFHEEEISIVGQRAAGVKGINLKAGDHLVSGFALGDNPESSQLLVVTQRGAMKKMKITEFDKTSRAKRGLVMVRELKSNPHRIVGMKRVSDAEKEFVLETASGKLERILTEHFKPADRYNNGSFIIDTGETGEVTRLKSLVTTDSSKE
jgi:topoisomerase-4 subunit A